LAFSVSKEKTTSSDVIGVPSCHFASGRMLKITQDRSSGTSTLSATRPYSVEASSSVEVISVS